MPSKLLVGELKRKPNIGLLLTHGTPHGVKMDTSRLSLENVDLRIPSYLAIHK
jgi:hypothetical protein